MIIILEDSRQKVSKHDLKHEWFDSHGISIRRTKLWVGDYTLPTNQSVCIDTKQNLNELVGNLTTSHDRFAKEADRAREAGIKLVFLIETDEDINNVDDIIIWNNPRYRMWLRQRVKKGRPPVSNEILIKIMKTFAEHHGCRWEFCRPENAGERIYEILFGGEESDGGTKKEA